MATVSGPSVARHPSRATKMPRAAPTQHAAAPDPYYGHEETAKICARFVSHLFTCPDHPPNAANNPSTPSPRLDIFIAYALHRTRLHESVTYAALYLLQRLKARFPAARGSSGHRLFISAFMLASKVICDDTYSNKSWSIVGQGMFALREINQMEREMCSYLEWQLNVDPVMLSEFEAKVKRDFKGTGPYPNYALPSPAPSPMPSTTPYTSAATGATAATPAPSFVTGRAPSTSPPKAHPRQPPPTSATNAPGPAPPEQLYLTPPSSPGSPDTPDASHSTSTSPASSASPPTPTGIEDYNAKIATPGGSVPMSVEPHKPVGPPHQHQPPQLQQRPRDASTSHHTPSRRPTKADLFAYAVPVSW